MFRTLNVILMLPIIILFNLRSYAAEVNHRPNVILVFIDDMGWGDFSCFGNQEVVTEHADRLANEGIRFEQFYVNSPICSPSRCAITTGQYPQRWKIFSYLANRQENEKRGCANWLDLEAPVLARYLHQAGYATGHFGKWHLGGQRDVGDAPLITEYGFDASLTNFEGLGDRVFGLIDTYDGKPKRIHALGSDNLGRGKIVLEERYLVTAKYVESAINFIKDSKSNNKPFYINLWPDDVHTPCNPPKELLGDGSPRARYLGMLKTMDQQLGVLYDFIRNDPELSKNTLILVCGDNGPDKGNGTAGPFRGYKTMLYEGGIRSSLITWGPGFIPGEKVGSINQKSVFAAIDLVPSILDFTKTEKPQNITFDGETLIDVLLGKSNASRKEVLYFRRPPDRDNSYGIINHPDLALRDGPWKFLCEYDGSEPQLYDLTEDLAETNNLAFKNPEITKTYSNKLINWHLSLPLDKGATYKTENKTNK